MPAWSGSLRLSRAPQDRCSGNFCSLLGTQTCRPAVTSAQRSLVAHLTQLQKKHRRQPNGCWAASGPGVLKQTWLAGAGVDVVECLWYRCRSVGCADIAHTDRRTINDGNQMECPARADRQAWRDTRSSSSGISYIILFGDGRHCSGSVPVRVSSMHTRYGSPLDSASPA